MNLIITADDYGYRRAYDEGIVEAAAAGALDAVSAMMGEGRDPDASALTATGVEIGLHLELAGEWPAAREARHEAIVADLSSQVRAFEERFERSPAFLDGHHHCHAAPKVAVPVAREARRLELPLRSVSARHARLLRCLGVRTQDRLVGRMAERESALPGEVRQLIEGETSADGTTEWMVHPGRRDPAGGSAYDAGREEDLELLLRLASYGRLRSLRATHAEALAAS